MPVIIQGNKFKYDLNVGDIEDGQAYMDEFGEIYIGNRFGEVKAFGVTGKSVIPLEGDSRRLRKITLEVTVK